MQATSDKIHQYMTSFNNITILQKFDCYTNPDHYQNLEKKYVTKMHSRHFKTNKQ